MGRSPTTFRHYKMGKINLMWGVPPYLLNSLHQYQLVRKKINVGIPPHKSHLYACIRWWEGGWGDPPYITSSVPDGRWWERRWMGEFTPQATFLHNYQMWEGGWGNSPHISPLVLDGGKKGGWGDSPHISPSVSDGGNKCGWGDSPTSFHQYHIEGRKVDGGIPGHLYAVSDGRKDGGLVGFPAHVSVRIPIFVFQYKMGERRLTWGFLPQLSIRIRWGKPICQYYVVRKNALWQSRFVRQR